MDKGSYTFQALSKKYEDFRGPAFEIKVDGTALNSTEMPITSLEVNLCADGSAGGCHFSVESLYDYSKYKWLNDLSKTVKVGSKLEISMGYVEKKEVFFGYVDEYSLAHGGATAPRLEVTGIDGLGYFMSCNKPIYAGQKEAKKVVEEILGACVSAGCAKSCTVGSLSGYTIPLVKEGMDDFQYLQQLAQRYGMHFFCVNGELVFDDVLSDSSAILTLKVGAGLLSFGKRQSLRGQVGEVQIWGRDVNQQFIQDSAKSVSIGSGKSATQIATAFSDTVVREYSEYVRTKAECKSMAQAKLNDIALGFVSGEGMCVGIPELIPGRHIKIDGLDGDTEGTFFLNKVNHTVTREGYYTKFEIKGAKA